MFRLVTICLTLSILAFAPAASSAQKTTANALFKLALLSDEDIADIKAGKIVAADTAVKLELKDSNLLAIVFVWVKAPLEKTARTLEHIFNTATKQPPAFSAVLKEGEPFPAISFAPGEANEAGRLLKFKGGGRFNLSASEIQKLKSVAKSTKDDAAVRAASEFMTAVLDARFRSYVERGLDGIEDYQRKKGKVTSPAEELRLLDKESKALEPYFPKLYQAIIGFPKKDPDLQYSYQVVKKTLNKRPTFILLQRITDARPEYVAVRQTEFYASHTYNSLAAGVLMVPYEGRTLVLMSTDAFTDKVAGAKSGIAKPVGRKHIRAAVLPLMESLKASAEGG